jgi:hypothetical protein
LGAGGRWFESSRPDHFPGVYSDHPLLQRFSGLMMRSFTALCDELIRRISTRYFSLTAHGLSHAGASVKGQPSFVPLWIDRGRRSDKCVFNPEDPPLGQIPARPAKGKGCISRSWRTELSETRQHWT